MTIGKKSAGLSFGVGWFRTSINSEGSMRSRFTVPGTGLYYEDRATIPNRQLRDTERGKVKKQAILPSESAPIYSGYARLVVYIASAILKALADR
jgi:hypothetical protein